jgi:hypothetical protein
MRLRIILALLASAAAVAASTVAFATSEARVLPNTWGKERKVTYAIYQPAIGRIGTAYYRVVQAELDTKPVYELRYTGQGDSLTESSVCTVDAVTLEPYKTTRKLKSASDTFFIDTFFGDGRIVVRRKQGDAGEVHETSQDFPGRIFDYEQLMWLIPQLDFSGDDRLHFALFSTVGDQTILVVVRKIGDDSFEFHGAQHKAVRYDFTLNMVRQSMWVQTIDGVPTTVRYDTGDTIFYDLDLLKAIPPAAKPAAKADDKAAAKKDEAKKGEAKPAVKKDEKTTDKKAETKKAEPKKTDKKAEAKKLDKKATPKKDEKKGDAKKAGEKKDEKNKDDGKKDEKKDEGGDKAPPYLIGDDGKPYIPF